MLFKVGHELIREKESKNDVEDDEQGAGVEETKGDVMQQETHPVLQVGRGEEQEGVETLPEKSQNVVQFDKVNKDEIQDVEEALWFGPDRLEEYPIGASNDQAIEDGKGDHQSKSHHVTD